MAAFYSRWPPLDFNEFMYLNKKSSCKHQIWPNCFLKTTCQICLVGPFKIQDGGLLSKMAAITTNGELMFLTKIWWYMHQIWLELFLWINFSNLPDCSIENPRWRPFIQDGHHNLDWQIRSSWIKKIEIWEPKLAQWFVRIHWSNLLHFLELN